MVSHAHNLAHPTVLNLKFGLMYPNHDKKVGISSLATKNLKINSNNNKL